MEDQETKKTKKPNKIVPIVLILLLAGGAAFGIKEYLFYRNFATTDDAQVDADINPVVSRVSGYVEEIRFQDNQLVHQGDTLVVLDNKDYLIKLEQAEAGMGTAHAQLQVSEAGVSSIHSNIAPAKANVEAAKAQLWQISQDYNRYKKLLEGHAITQSQFDAIQAQKETAEAKLAAAQKQVDAIKSQIQTSIEQVGATKSGITSQKAAIDFAKLQLSYTYIIAPVTGIVSKRNIQIGQLVGAGQTLFAVVNINHIYITANFKETQLTHMSPGQKVNIEIDAYPKEKFEGVVESFSGATGAKFSLLPPDNATGNFVKVVQRLPVRITFNHLSEEWKKKLMPGLSAQVNVAIKES